MPACYAHYRFGKLLLNRLPQEYKRPVRNFPQLFLAGLQGPDPFFYHNPLIKDKVVKLGSAIHRQSGKEFFRNACAAVNSEAAMAYLLGLLGHYSLDSLAHPYVQSQTAEGKISHTELESEFERFLLKLDGHDAPHTVNRGEHLHLTPGECETAAAFYPGLKPLEMQGSIRKMANFLKLLAEKKPEKRRILRKLMGVPGGELRHHLMWEWKNTACAQHNDPMLALFNEALERYFVLLQQLTDHLQNQKPLGKAFDPDFG